MRKFFIGGWLYDWALEPALKNMKKKVAECISHFGIYPVLDICCGSGVQCYYIIRDGDRVYGLDLDVRMIHYAASKYPRIPFVCADAVDIPIKDSSFGGVILSYALHDKLPGIRSKIIREVRRVLSPVGRIVFVDFEVPWNRKSRIASLYTYGIERMAGKNHFRNGRQFLHQGGLRSFIRNHGLEEIERHDVEAAHTGIVVARFT